MAISSGSDFFHTDLLFAPTGTDLTLHTHMALPAFVGATAFGWLPVIAAQNLTLLISLFLNGFCAYLLAWRIRETLAPRIVIRGPSTPSRRLAASIGIGLALDVALIAAIVITGGLDAPIGPIRSVRGVFNPLQAFWILLAALLLLWFLRARPLVPRHVPVGADVCRNRIR